LVFYINIINNHQDNHTTWQNLINKKLLLFWKCLQKGKTLWWLFGQSIKTLFCFEIKFNIKVQYLINKCFEIMVYVNIVIWKINGL
jgi:hypothetical protein